MPTTTTSKTSTSSPSPFLSQISFTTIRFTFTILCLLSLIGPILLIIGIGVLRAPGNYDQRVDSYNQNVGNFTRFESENLLQTSAKLIQRKQSTDSNNQISSTIAVELVLGAVPARQPFPSRPSLPHGNDLIDVAVQSIPITSNLSSSSYTEAIDRSLWNEVIYENNNNNQESSSSSQNHQIRATTLNVTDSNGKTTQIPLPSLFQTKTYSSPSTLCYPKSGDKICTKQRMTELCRKQSKCGNAVFNYSTSSTTTLVSGKSYPGCSWVRYQTTLCIPVSYSKKNGFEVSKKLKSCVFPFEMTSTSLLGESTSSTSLSGSEYSSGGIYNPTVVSKDAELQAFTSCSLNVSLEDGDGQHYYYLSNHHHDDNKLLNLPLRVMLMLDSDPFIIAQNMTKGTNLFPGLPANVEKDLGLNFVIAGACLTVVAGLCWFLLKFLMQRDEASARHIYKAFGQVYIPSTNDYVNAIAQGRGYKHSHGFVPRNLENSSSNNRKSVSMDRAFNDDGDNEKEVSLLSPKEQGESTSVVDVDNSLNSKKKKSVSFFSSHEEKQRQIERELEEEEIMKMLREASSWNNHRSSASAAPAPMQKISSRK